MGLVQTFLAITTLVTFLTGENFNIHPKNTTVQLIFTGTTPCSQMIRPLHHVPVDADCALVQWRLTLNYDPVSLKPTTYKLSSVNRFIVKGTNRYSEPGTKTETEGEWTIVNRTKRNSNAIVYQLEPDKPGKSISFIKLSDNLIHLLDVDGRLMIGDASFSYTLNRVAN
jgi:hypothetical protein